MEITSEWRKSTKCGSAPDCAEVRLAGELIEVRNSDSPDAGTTRFTRGEWRAFTAGVKDEEFEV